jgi:hypothetical protein
LLQAIAALHIYISRAIIFAAKSFSYFGRAARTFAPKKTIALAEVKYDRSYSN